VKTAWLFIAVFEVGLKVIGGCFVEKRSDASRQGSGSGFEPQWAEVWRHGCTVVTIFYG
jgi:hypothetical protein